MDSIKTIRLDSLVGANLYMPRSAVRVALEWQDAARRLVAAPPGSALASLFARLPELAAPAARAAPAVAGLRDRGPAGAIDPADLIRAAILAIHRDIGLEDPDARVCEHGDGSRADVVFEVDDARLGLRIATAAAQWVQGLLSTPNPDAARPVQDPAALMESFRRQVAGTTPNTDGAHLRREARRHDIPTLYLGRNLTVFGQGCRQRRIWGQVTDRTSHLAYVLASDKHAAAEALRRVGLPVPRHRLVYDLTQASDAAQSIGFPLVVKPVGTDKGVGVSVGIRSQEGLARAFETARRLNPGVLVEQQIPGNDYRLLVIDGRFVAAAQRIPAHVFGDGLRTVEELVAEENRNPLRRSGKTAPLSTIDLDEEAVETLRQSGLTTRSVPGRGQQVFLRRLASLSRGGVSVDVTAAVHPANRQLAVLAARAIGLDVAGVDFLTPDIGRPWREVGGGICEINPTPGMRAHYAPARGTPQDVAGPVFELLFPSGAPSRIPVAAVTGSDGKTTTVRMLAHILRHVGGTVGMVCTEGVYVQDECLVEGDMSGGWPARQLLMDPRIDAAVLEIARGAILKFGAGIEDCDVAAVTNIADEHLGELGVDSLEALARVKGLLVEIARDTVVLNADDPLCVSLAARSRAQHLCYVTMGAVPPLAAHVASGGRAVCVEAEGGVPWIVLYTGETRLPLSPVGDLPATWEGRARHNVQNAMFAAAMAHALGRAPAEIAAALRTFRSDVSDNRGRLNRYRGAPFEFLVDYCHNRHGIEAIGAMTAAIAIEGRRLLAFALAGNHRDEDFESAGREAARHFDVLVAYAPQERYLRGRSVADVAGRTRRRIPRGSRRSVGSAGCGGRGRGGPAAVRRRPPGRPRDRHRRQSATLHRRTAAPLARRGTCVTAPPVAIRAALPPASAESRPRSPRSRAGRSTRPGAAVGRTARPACS